jgi:uncharacterized protein YegL
MKKTELICVIDRSGSMNRMTKAAIEGFNAFVDSQKELDPNANITTVLFDHEYKLIHDNIPINNIEYLSVANYIPRGSTALLDAIGKAVGTVHERLMESGSEANVVCAILTDGEENSSQEHSHEDIKILIKKMTDEFNWEFAYLGANDDAFSVAEGLNISRGNTMQFAATEESLGDTYTMMSRGVSSYRMRSKSGSYEKGTLFKGLDDSDDLKDSLDDLKS